MRRPGGGATAILTRTNEGATTSYGYRVYLQADEDGRIIEAFRADKTNAAPLIVWEEPDRLSISAPCGQIYRYSNFSVIPNASKGWDKIYIALDNKGLCQ